MKSLTHNAAPLRLSVEGGANHNYLNIPILEQSMEISRFLVNVY